MFWKGFCICHAIVDSFATSAKLCAVRKVILEFLNCADIYWTPSLSRSPLTLPFLFALSPLLFISLSLSLSASCQHWQSATQALAARLVTDAAAVRQREEKERALKGVMEGQRAIQKNEGKTHREEKWEEERRERQQRLGPPRCVKKGHGVGLGHGQ